MEFTKKASFIKQINIFIKNKDDNKAYDLARNFVEKFPDDMVSHFLLAKAAFNVKKFEEAKKEGVIAFNKAHVYDDMLAAALLTSTAYLEIKEYRKGFHMLKEMEKKGTSEELQLALLTFSLALNNENEAYDHIVKLYKLNEKKANELIERMIGV